MHLLSRYAKREVGRGSGRGRNQSRKFNNRYIVSIHSLLLFQRSSRAEGGFDSPYPEIAASRTLFPSSTQSQRAPDLKNRNIKRLNVTAFSKWLPFRLKNDCSSFKCLSITES
ncbi:hypothetical protein I7I48_06675 [Histoplasma ohiense]|nr:hypothetical protein I7I48_06675 [Histoplasma ohiense (nom. inval.)]